MSRKHRVLTTLALSFALAAATTAVAVAGPAPIEDQHDRWLRNLEAGQAQRTQAAFEQARSLERNADLTAAVAAPVEDQHDRLLRGLEAAQARRTQAAVEQVRASERNLTPVTIGAAAQPARPAVTTVPGRDLDVLAVLLLGLIGGLAGGAIALIAWITMGSSRPRRTAAAA